MQKRSNSLISRVILFSVLSAVGETNSVPGLFLGQEVGYVYPPPPLPPVHLDELQPMPPLYLPPIFSDDVPQLGYLPPGPPSPVQPPPMYPNDDSVVISAQPPNLTLQPPYFRIENMSCVQGMSFRAIFKVGTNSPHFPVVDDGADNCVISISTNQFKIDLDDFNSMVKCGVKRCKSSETEKQNESTKNLQIDGKMCVMVRMPTVKGVRLPEDGIVTLMCTPQERIVSQTRHVKLGSKKIQQISRARSNAGVIATGGTQNDLKTRIGIFRKQPGSQVFDQKVQLDSLIELGEELLLRTVVNEGDGWKSSLIGPVLITGLNSKKTALLVNQQGCVNQEMKSICPRQPQKISPLITELHFRAFLFQDSPYGDEMVVSVRTQGCLHVQDCSRDQSCVDASSSRVKRDLQRMNYNRSKSENKYEENLDIRDWQTQFKFKVEPVSHRGFSKISSNYYFLFLSLSLAAAILSLLAIILVLWRYYC